jgi:microcystin-dependent protein
MQFNNTKIGMTLSAAFVGCISVIAAPASRASCVPEPYLASICITSANFCPRGYTDADGRMLSISNNQTLFSLLGANYGGDGVTNFALPDLRGRTPVGFGRGPGLSIVMLGQRRGTELQVLDITQLPKHNHKASFVPAPGDGLQASTKAGSSASPDSDSYLGKVAITGMGTPPSLYTDDESNLTPIKGMNVAGAVEVGNSGESQPFPIIPPQLGLRYCIATEGLYPPRN